MAWYKTGTVTVTNGSATVTGAGTAFVGSVLAGQGFAAPDGKIYEIEAVVSATGLTLASPYLGATAAGAAYGVIPTIGGLSAFASRLDTLLTAMQGVVDGAGQGKFAAGTPAAPGMRFLSDGDTGLTNPVANQLGIVTGGTRRALLTNTALQVDVPLTGTAVTQTVTDTTAGRLLKVGDFGLGKSVALTGATDLKDRGLKPGFYSYSANIVTGGPETAAYTHTLIVAQPDGIDGRRSFIDFRPTGSPSSARMWFGSQTADTDPILWQRILINDSILGTVSQAAGIPTGAVIERGSNANGDYVRFADGTQICVLPRWLPVLTGVTTTAPATLTVTLPASFAASTFTGQLQPLITADSGTGATGWEQIVDRGRGSVSARVSGSSVVVVLYADSAGFTGVQGAYNITVFGRWF